MSLLIRLACLFFLATSAFGAVGKWATVKSKISTISAKNTNSQSAKDLATKICDDITSQTTEAQGVADALSENLEGLMGSDPIAITQSVLSIASTVTAFLPGAGTAISGILGLVSTLFGLGQSQGPTMEKMLTDIIDKAFAANEMSQLREALSSTREKYMTYQVALDSMLRMKHQRSVTCVDYDTWSNTFMDPQQAMLSDVSFFGKAKQKFKDLDNQNSRLCDRIDTLFGIAYFGTVRELALLALMGQAKEQEECDNDAAHGQTYQMVFNMAETNLQNLKNDIKEMVKEVTYSCCTASSSTADFALMDKLSYYPKTAQPYGVIKAWVTRFYSGFSATIGHNPFIVTDGSVKNDCTVRNFARSANENMDESQVSAMKASFARAATIHLDSNSIKKTDNENENQQNNKKPILKAAPVKFNVREYAPQRQPQPQRPQTFIAPQNYGSNGNSEDYAEFAEMLESTLAREHFYDALMLVVVVTGMIITAISAYFCYVCLSLSKGQMAGAGGAFKPIDADNLA